MSDSIREALTRAGFMPPEKTKAELKYERREYLKSAVAQWQKPFQRNCHILIKGGRRFRRRSPDDTLTQ
jgi:hypothetical protein